MDFVCVNRNEGSLDRRSSSESLKLLFRSCCYINIGRQERKTRGRHFISKLLFCFQLYLWNFSPREAGMYLVAFILIPTGLLVTQFRAGSCFSDGMKKACSFIFRYSIAIAGLKLISSLSLPSWLLYRFKEYR